MAEPDAGRDRRPSRVRTGAGLLNRNLGRILVFVYGVLALSASGRAVVQIATKFDKAPGPYTLSAVAAVVYLLATWALGTSRNRTAVAVVAVEFVGVLVVGATHSASVPLDKQTVWTDFGSGYGYVPLLLPFVVVGWLWHNRPRPIA